MGEFTSLVVGAGTQVNIYFVFQRPTCKTLYSPDKVVQDWPDANLMICEETFAWLGKI